MSARDRYRVNVRCETCGEAGHLNISENTFPYFRTPDREIEEVVGNFRASLRNDVDIDITCTICGRMFSYL
jgi:hypothetical protein